jgi:hypothetical protein
MNRLLGIEHDSDIASANVVPPADEVRRFEEEDLDGPSLCPLQPNWQSVNSVWNDHLSELFLDHFKMLYEDQINVDDETEREIDDIFRCRLRSLRRELKKSQPKRGEDRNATKERVKQSKLRALARQRPNTRRKHVRSP